MGYHLNFILDVRSAMYAVSLLLGGGTDVGDAPAHAVNLKT